LAYHVTDFFIDNTSLVFLRSYAIDFCTGFFIGDKTIKSEPREKRRFTIFTSYVEHSLTVTSLSCGLMYETEKSRYKSFLEKLELYRLTRPLAFTMLTKSLYKLYRLLGSLLVEDIAAARLVYVFTELLVLPSYTITYDTLTRAYSV
jgi:hypothetical protein